MGVGQINVVANPVRPDRLHLHLHAPGQQLVALEDGRHAVAYVMLGTSLEVGGHPVFVGGHSRVVELAGPGDQVFQIIVLPGQLVTNQVATVVQPARLDALVVPRGRIDDQRLALPLRHQLPVQQGVSRRGAIIAVQVAVGLPSAVFGRQGGPTETGVVVVDHLDVVGLGPCGVGSLGFDRGTLSRDLFSGALPGRLLARDSLDRPAFGRGLFGRREGQAALLRRFQRDRVDLLRAVQAPVVPVVKVVFPRPGDVDRGRVRHGGWGDRRGGD